MYIYIYIYSKYSCNDIYIYIYIYVYICHCSYILRYVAIVEPYVTATFTGSNLMKGQDNSIEAHDFF